MKFQHAVRNTLAAAALATLAGSVHAALQGDPEDKNLPGPGAVYTLTNSAAGNGLAVMSRSPRGTITARSIVDTGGLGTGSGLGSQGALAFGDDGATLYAVNAGSSEISVFRIGAQAPTLVQVIASSGTQPISIAVHGDLLYVLNNGGLAGAADEISGFRIGQDGALTPLPDSTKPLSAASVGPAQIGFSADGSVLIVTEKNTNLIDTFVVGPDGVAGDVTTHASSGATPFGFSIDHRGRLIVTEAFGGAANQSAVSSYSIGNDGSLALIDGSVSTQQTAACWAASTQNSKFTYTGNTGSASVSGFRVGNQGGLAPLSVNGRTGETAATPIDVAVVGNRFLYVLTSGGHEVQGFLIGSDGALTPLNAVTGLPAGDVGLVSR